TSYQKVGASTRRPFVFFGEPAAVAEAGNWLLETGDWKLSAIAALHGRRVERQCRDRVHRGHDLPVGGAAVEGLDVALAHVAAVQAVEAVAGRERGDPGAVGVEAPRAGELVEAPAGRASRADEQPLGGRRDHREVGLAAAERAVAVRPALEQRAGHDRIGA